jgi:asparagine synthase (glutamine-hydrolysing)
MCGISGVVDIQGRLDREIVRTAVERMTRHLIHRGPDGRGFWESSNGNICIGHTRLSIVDLSAGSSQPMVDPTNRYVLSFNGELYNYKKLRAELEAEGQRFSTSGDTEVFLRALSTWGPYKFLRRADGMFAAALFDQYDGTLTLMRDLAGEKPLFFSTDRGVIRFASELRALEASCEVSLEIDVDSVFLYLLLRYVPAPFSMFKGVEKLEAGYFVQFFSDGRIRRKRYGEFQIQPLLPFSESAYRRVVDEFEEAFVESLASRMVADVPIGLFLSGGIDSTLCAVLAKRRLGVDLRSFSIGIEGDSKSEHIVAQHTARLLGIENKTLMVSKDDFDRALISGFAIQDEPNGDRSCPLTLLLSQFARKDVTVAIGGDGGDELFGGYTRYQSIDSEINDARFAAPLNMLLCYLQTRLSVFSVPVLLNMFKDHNRRALDFLEKVSFNFLPPLQREVSVRVLDFRTYLPGAVLSKVDRLSMSSSLEVRTPFFHPKILMMAGMLSIRYLSRGAERKPILRDIIRRFGHENVAALPKTGFGTPPSLMQRSIKTYDRIRQASLESKRVTALFEEVPGLESLFAESHTYGANAFHAETALRAWLGNRPTKH